jgi:hypothetical protein
MHDSSPFSQRSYFLNRLLDFLHDAFHGNGVYHYAFVSEAEFNDTAANRWRRDFNVHCLRYQPSTGHPEVGDFVQNLLKSVS